MPNHVWSYDFVEERTHDGWKFRIMYLINSHPRGPCHPGQAKAQLYRLLETLAGVMMLRGRAGICSVHNGPEFIALALRKWITALELPAGSIEHGSPWTNGYTPSS